MPPNPTRRIGAAVLVPALAVHGRIVTRLAATDDAAQVHGWTVETRRFGGRTYRDPRFDQLTHRAAPLADEPQEALR